MANNDAKGVALVGYCSDHRDDPICVRPITNAEIFVALGGVLLILLTAIVSAYPRKRKRFR